VDLTVFNGSGQSSSCSTTVSFFDTTAPVLTCPEDITIGMNESLDPTNTGTATAVDACNSSVAVTYVDTVSPSFSLVGTNVVLRTWTAVDGCSNSSSCVQTITIAPAFAAHVDIQPQVCPNPFFPAGRSFGEGELPVSVLGNKLDVTDIVLTSVRMTRVPIDGGQEVDYIRPISAVIVDDAEPFLGNPCGCHTEGPDGIDDLSMQFSEPLITQAFGLANEPPGTFVELAITGSLTDGT
jgi:hypothetical protein